MNTYGYVDGNPVKNFDPYGLTSITANGTQAGSGTSSSSSGVMSNIIRTNPAGIATSAIIYSPSAGEGSDTVPPPPYFSDKPQQCDSDDAERCKKVKQQCIQGCSDFVLNKPKKRRNDLGGMDFHSCVRKCMDKNGCY